MVSPYWSFWEGVVEGDPRGLHKHLVETAVATADDYGEVVWSVLADDLDHTLPAVDLIIVVVTMASPPQVVRAFVQQRPGIVVLVWADHLSPDIAEPFTHESITLRGATVGASMLTASLTTAGVPHDCVLGNFQSKAVHRSMRAAAAAAIIRGSRLSVIGKPLEGYDFVTPPAGEVERLGIEIVAHGTEGFATRVASVPDAAVGSLLSELGDGWSDSTTPAGAQAAARYALALDELVIADGSLAGTVNCHVADLRLGDPAGGVAPCFALGRQTSRGLPWTCTGDVNTSLAMLLVASLGLPTMYHEMEAIDEATDEVILANSGEHDDRFSSTTDRRVVANPWFPGENPTPIVAFQVAPGPASVVAVVSVKGRLRVLVAEGRFTGRDTESTGTMTAAFQFTGGSAASMWREWVRAGAGHHACATDVHIRTDLSALCQHLGLECVAVGGS